MVLDSLHSNVSISLMRLRHSGFGAVLVLVALSACARRTPSTMVRPRYPEISVIPIPVSVTRLSGPAFRITPASAIVADTTSTAERLAAVAFAAIARPSTGYPLPIVANLDSINAAIRAPTDTNRRSVIRLRLTAGGDQGAEGYSLASDLDSVVITAATGAGLFHGVQTFRQLLPFGIDGHQSAIQMGPWTIPPVRISDAPSYAWRGSMLDVARHFFTPDEVKQYIDILALYKLNTLHLHLGDDQGWRIEIKSHPELTAMGAGSEVGGGQGGFFTQADYTDLVKYAQDRYIMIVPEIDMPGHINAALISHPELQCGRRKPAIFTGISGGFNAICPDSEGTYTLLNDVIRELAALTPGPYIHIGGDEVQGLTPEQYAKFVQRVQSTVIATGKRMIGWEEIAHAALDSSTLVQQWQGDSLRIPVPAANEMILSAAPHMYLDMRYNPLTELGLRWAGNIEVQKAYDWDPTTAIKALGSARVVGLEAPLWSETPRNITAVEFLVMPRLPAIAEVAWSPASRRSWDDFRQRLPAHGPRWNILGINYYRSAQIRW
jgi:hexosaminidase